MSDPLFIAVHPLHHWGSVLDSECRNKILPPNAVLAEAVGGFSNVYVPKDEELINIENITSISKYAGHFSCIYVKRVCGATPVLESYEQLYKMLSQFIWTTHP